MRDEACCKIFGINMSTIDVFKEYFFQHGVFYYKSIQPFTQEYGNVLDFFKNAQTQKKFTFCCIPFCKIGYDTSDQAQGKQQSKQTLTDKLSA